MLIEDSFAGNGYPVFKEIVFHGTYVWCLSFFWGGFQCLSVYRKKLQTFKKSLGLCLHCKNFGVLTFTEIPLRHISRSWIIIFIPFNDYEFFSLYIYLEWLIPGALVTTVYKDISLFDQKLVPSFGKVRCLKVCQTLYNKRLFNQICGKNCFKHFC